MIKKLLILVALLIILLGYAIYKNHPIDYSNNMPIYETKGLVIHHKDESRNFWGLKVSFWDNPLGPRRLRLSNLPVDFQEENIKVRVKYGFADVTGNLSWGVVVDVIGIEKIK